MESRIHAHLIQGGSFTAKKLLEKMPRLEREKNWRNSYIKLNHKDKEKIILMLRNGGSQLMISREYNVHKSSIWLLAKHAGLTKKYNDK